MKTNTLFKILIATALMFAAPVSSAGEGLSINDITDFFSSGDTKDTPSGDACDRPLAGRAALDCLQKAVMGDGVDMISAQHMTFSTYMFTDVASAGIDIPAHQQPGIQLIDYIVFKSDSSGNICSTDKVYMLNKELVSGRQGLSQSYVFESDELDDNYLPKTIGLSRPLQLHDFANRVVELLTLKPYSDMDDKDKERLTDLVILASLAKALKAIYAGDVEGRNAAIETAKNVCGSVDIQSRQVELLRRDTKLIANPLFQMNEIVTLFADRGNAPAEFVTFQMSADANALTQILNVPMPNGYIRTFVTEEATGLLPEDPGEGSQQINFVAAHDANFDPEVFSCANQGYTYMLNPEAPDPSLFALVLETKNIDPEAEDVRGFFKLDADAPDVPFELIMGENVKIDQTLQRLKQANDAKPTDPEVVRQVNASAMMRFLPGLLEAVKMEGDQRQEALNQIIPILQGLCSEDNGPQLRESYLTNLLELTPAEAPAPADGALQRREGPAAEETDATPAEEATGPRTLTLERRATPADEEETPAAEEETD